MMPDCDREGRICQSTLHIHDKFFFFFFFFVLLISERIFSIMQSLRMLRENSRFLYDPW